MRLTRTRGRFTDMRHKHSLRRGQAKVKERERGYARCYLADSDKRWMSRGTAMNEEAARKKEATLPTAAAKKRRAWTGQDRTGRVR